jgi:hypothetical protein
MPTGYTAKLADGEQTFYEFVWGCARAFGALVMMRELPLDAPITDDRLLDHWARERVLEAQAQLAERVKKKDKEQRAAYEHEKAERAGSLAALEATRIRRLRRYHAMLLMCRAWHPPSAEHVRLKEFMIEQLETSITVDCEPWKPPAFPPFEQWRAESQAELERALSRAEASDKEEIERNEKRLRWVHELRLSVGPPKAAP